MLLIFWCHWTSCLWKCVPSFFSLVPLLWRKIHHSVLLQILISRNLHLFTANGWYSFKNNIFTVFISSSLLRSDFHFFPSNSMNEKTHKRKCVESLAGNFSRMDVVFETAAFQRHFPDCHQYRKLTLNWQQNTVPLFPVFDRREKMYFHQCEIFPETRI